MGRNGKNCKHSGKWKNATEVYQREDVPNFLDRFLLMRAVFLDKENAVDHIFFGLQENIVAHGKL